MRCVWWPHYKWCIVTKTHTNCINVLLIIVFILCSDQIQNLVSLFVIFIKLCEQFQVAKTWLLTGNLYVEPRSTFWNRSKKSKKWAVGFSIKATSETESRLGIYLFRSKLFVLHFCTCRIVFFCAWGTLYTIVYIRIQLYAYISSTVYTWRS